MSVEGVCYAVWDVKLSSLMELLILLVMDLGEDGSIELWAILLLSLE